MRAVIAGYLRDAAMQDRYLGCCVQRRPAGRRLPSIATIRVAVIRKALGDLSSTYDKGPKVTKLDRQKRFAAESAVPPFVKLPRATRDAARPPAFVCVD